MIKYLPYVMLFNVFMQLLEPVAGRTFNWQAAVGWLCSAMLADMVRRAEK